jgi:hypothetical protein
MSCRKQMVLRPKTMGNKAVTALTLLCLLAAGLLSAGARGAGDPALEAAREELRLRVETERRMRKDFESLLAGGRMSAAEVADFEDYLVDLGIMVDQQRSVVAKLQGDAEHSIQSSASGEPLPPGFSRGQTDAEKIAMLDAQLGTSLSEFDEKLLREQQEIAEKSRGGSAGDGDEGAEGGQGAPGGSADGGGENQQVPSGGGAGGSAGESSQSKSGESGQQSTSKEQAETGGDVAGDNEQVASTGGTSDVGRQQSNSSVPPDIPDGKDDDIVARQLREAAETEQDPELRAKLWEEYRKYKNRTR